MKTLLNYISATAIFFFASMSAQAEVKLPSVLSDGVVLQRDHPIPVWGTASPGERVKVTLGGRKGEAIADSAGNWEVRLEPLSAGGPYELHAGNVTVSDVLIGDLYLCSGQSNMELPVGRVLDKYAEIVATYENHNIREFKTPKEPAFHGPVADCSPAEWKRVTVDKVNSWGALTYFIARQLYDRNGGVPVGIVNSSWGGSRIDTWISEPSLAPWPERTAQLHIMTDDALRESIARSDRGRRDAWQNEMVKRDNGYHDMIRWSNPGLDDDAWDSVDLLDAAWGIDERGRAVNGSHWFRKHFDVDASHAGKPATLRLGCIVDADSVWVNGTFVGVTFYQYPPRIYKIPASVIRDGENVVTVRLVSDTGKPHFVPEKPYKVMFDDGNETSLLGKWKHRLGIRMPQAPNTTDFFQTPSVLYNGLIAPMTRLPFRGVVWYQGESDVDNADLYATLLETLMNDWRHAMGRGKDLPYYIIELADFLHPSDTEGRKAWQEMRDAQRKASESTPGATWIRNGDVGEWNDIHPLDKLTPATRVVDAMLNDR